MENELQFGCLECGSHGLHAFDNQYFRCDACGGVFRVVIDSHEGTGLFYFDKIK